MNQPGRTVDRALPRVDFFHWAVWDLPADLREIAAGSQCSGVTARGKGPSAPLGRHGLNDYTGWFAGDPAMAGDYHGYDGPCPPWNDERVHRYRITLWALDVANLPVQGRDGAALRAAIVPHVLAAASLDGTYAIFPGAT